MTKKYKGFTIETRKCYVTTVYNKEGNQVGEAQYDYSIDGKEFSINLIKKQIDNGELQNSSL